MTASLTALQWAAERPTHDRSRPLHLVSDRAEWRRGRECTGGMAGDAGYDALCGARVLMLYPLGEGSGTRITCPACKRLAGVTPGREQANTLHHRLEGSP